MLEAVRKKNPRPATWDDVIGNKKAVEIIREAMAAAEKSETPIPHLLLVGPPGVGKSTVSKIVAASSGDGHVETTASSLQTPADVIGLINKLNVMREQTGKPSVLFLDEIHRLSGPRGRQSRIDPESIYSLLEDWNFPHPLADKPVVIDGRPRGGSGCYDRSPARCHVGIPARRRHGVVAGTPFASVGTVTFDGNGGAQARAFSTSAASRDAIDVPGR